ncbi:methyl-accepting chemotaxis protein [Niallia sp. NCCP-28]|uniref:methyl-accepting chemotaxis protein n=1 Tax=Niallia sp. NCCP-28 TaxID=2934712 RepID=UPI00208D8984|nr:methyl-accepting chemotaxis protein [Niallia sp. NCCP-28]GKU84867.1 hypothetical protein NCCP28_42630 [Niallia sp. NCCP-28]
MSIRQKFLAGFGVILLFIAAIASLGFYGNKHADYKLDGMMEEDYALVSLSTKMELNVSNRVMLARGYVLYGDETYKERFLEETEKAAALKEQIKQLMGNSSSYQDAVAKSSKWENLIIDQVIPAYEKEGFDGAIPLMRQYCQTWSEDAMNAWISIQETADANMIHTNNTIQEENALQQQLFIVLAVLTAIVAIAVAFWMSRSIVTPILAVAKQLTLIGKGDLSVVPLSFKRKDEFQTLASTLNDMVKNLKDMFSRITTIESNLYTTSNGLLSNREDLKDKATAVKNAIDAVESGSAMQMESAVETARAMDAVSISMEHIANASSQASDYSVRVNQYASEGNRIVQGVIKELTELDISVKETSDSITSLHDKTDRIGEISALIHDISEQTNLLSLNAAIEAARAGEHGRGFEVVANEVRKLAERTKESSGEIVALITTIKKDTDGALSSTLKSQEEMEASLHAANNGGLAFKNIAKAVQSISAQIQEVSASSEEVSASVEEITASVEQLSGIAKENVEYVQNVASSTESQMESMHQVGISIEELNKMARELKGVVEKFEV